MYTLGIDLGSSSVKASVFDVRTGKSISSAHYPEKELAISAPFPGWAEQDPATWWECAVKAVQSALGKGNIDQKKVRAIGISYQMHGLVLVDEAAEVARPAIIWCDSRAVHIGEEAAAALGNDYCQRHLLNSPGNFTASKLRWVIQSEPNLYNKVHKFMLPGDYLAFKLTGEMNTTAPGLSEGIMWDFEQQQIADKLLEQYEIPGNLIPTIIPTFGPGGQLGREGALAMGLEEGIPVSYRAGDQPNNAFSLNVLHPGEVAATAGTSGVIYAVTDKNLTDEASRVNTFLHVTGTPAQKRNGVLLCVNGSGILYSWLKKNVGLGRMGYEEMNAQASKVAPGANELQFYPFGNGAERVLQNRMPNATLCNLDFNRHNVQHVYRAGQEGVAYALNYGFEALMDIGIETTVIRAGKANMFLSPVFREAFVNTTGISLELYDADGAEGAARAAAYGAGFYPTLEDAFENLRPIDHILPSPALADQYQSAYKKWKEGLENQLRSIELNHTHK